MTKIRVMDEDLSNKITKFYASNQGETHITDSDNGKIQDMMLYGKSSQDGTPTPENPVEIKSVVNPTVKVSNEDGTKSQTVTLPYTLNAIPVSSGGNVTIDGQQYIADYVDVERGKIVQMVQREKLINVVEISITNATHDEYIFDCADSTKFRDSVVGIINIANFDDISGSDHNISRGVFAVAWGKIYLRLSKMALPQTIEDMKKWLNNNDLYCILPLTSPTEIDLSSEEITAFKALATYYPTTNISINSEQLDGYAVFNYPISLANGWNYVKQQLNDNRDYIYDMDLQSAEAYVNSEYAVTLTELEV